MRDRKRDWDSRDKKKQEEHRRKLDDYRREKQQKGKIREAT